MIIKPDGVRRGLIGSVIARGERLGLKIAAIRLRQPDAKMFKLHYFKHEN